MFYRLIKLIFYENKIVLQEVGLFNVLYFTFIVLDFNFHIYKLSQEFTFFTIESYL